MNNLIQQARGALIGMKAQARHIESFAGRGAAEAIWIAIRGLERAILEHEIVFLSEGGQVAVIESGRDCDCVEYDGYVRIIDATIDAFEALDTQIGESADGPYHLRLCRISNLDSVEYTSRDLVMKAYEDGHPHHIVSSF